MSPNNTLSPQAQKMLQEIEDVIADKTLQFGCEVIPPNPPTPLHDDFLGRFKRRLTFQIVYTTWRDEFGNEFEPDKILGTPPDLCRVLQWLYNDKTLCLTKAYPYQNFASKVVSLWDLSKSLLRDQEEDLIKFLYPLIVKK